MIDLKLLEGLAERISAALPKDVVILQDEFRANVRAILEAALTRMEVVTREEFDAQAALLRRTREKLDTLEKQLAELEKGGGGA